MLFSRSQDFCAFPEDLLNRLFDREQGAMPEFAVIVDTSPPTLLYDEQTNDAYF